MRAGEQVHVALYGATRIRWARAEVVDQPFAGRVLVHVEGEPALRLLEPEFVHVGPFAVCACARCIGRA